MIMDGIFYSHLFIIAVDYNLPVALVFLIEKGHLCTSGSLHFIINRVLKVYVHLMGTHSYVIVLYIFLLLDSLCISVIG